MLLWEVEAFTARVNWLKIGGFRKQIFSLIAENYFRALDNARKYLQF